jgi:hypothetical protein
LNHILFSYVWGKREGKFVLFPFQRFTMNLGEFFARWIVAFVLPYLLIEILPWKLDVIHLFLNLIIGLDKEFSPCNQLLSELWELRISMNLLFSNSLFRRVSLIFEIKF